MKRPRLYRDRVWIEGYAEMAERIGANRLVPSFYPRMSRMEAEWKLRVWTSRERDCRLARKMTGREWGACAALLDAFGL